MVWLWQEAGQTPTSEPLEHVFLSESAAEDDGHHRTGAAEFAIGLFPVHPRHGEVHEDQADPVLVRLKDLQGFQTIPRFKRIETQAAKGVNRHGPEGVFVVHHQDRTRSLELCALDSWGRRRHGLGLCRCGRGREEEFEGGALPDLAGDPDASLVAPKDALDH